MRRIVYVEDGDWRVRFAPVWKNGFGEEVKLQVRDTFDQVREDLEGKSLADVYILDNEVEGDPDRGAELAQRIYDEAKASGREVLVITLLCSAPSRVRKIHGDELDRRGIPMFYKTTQGMVCGFWVGRCLQEGRLIGFEEWRIREGVEMPGEGFESLLLQASIMNRIANTEAGAFYLNPREFVDREREGLTIFMKPEVIAELNRVFPSSQGIEEKG